MAKWVLTGAEGQFHSCQSPPDGALVKLPRKFASLEKVGVDCLLCTANPRNVIVESLVCTRTGTVKNKDTNTLPCIFPPVYCMQNVRIYSEKSKSAWVNNNFLKSMANAWYFNTINMDRLTHGQSCTCRSGFILLVWRDPQRYRIGVCGALPSTAVRAKEKGQFGPHGVGLVCWGVRVEQAATGAPVGNAMEDVAAMSNNAHENAAAARLAILSKQPVWFCCVIKFVLRAQLIKSVKEDYTELES